ncbi:hypothetical protein HYQ46_009282 [Verticillium longisporum]|nr:hypothetical protein HYQ46_009282 [Verticillium longisporum]
MSGCPLGPVSPSQKAPSRCPASSASSRLPRPARCTFVPAFEFVTIFVEGATCRVPQADGQRNKLVDALRVAPLVRLLGGKVERAHGGAGGILDGKLITHGQRLRGQNDDERRAPDVDGQDDGDPGLAKDLGVEDGRKIVGGGEERVDGAQRHGFSAHRQPHALLKREDDGRGQEAGCHHHRVARSLQTAAQVVDLVVAEMRTGHLKMSSADMGLGKARLAGAVTKIACNPNPPRIPPWNRQGV